MSETRSRFKFINGVLCIEDPREQENLLTACGLLSKEEQQKGPSFVDSLMKQIAEQKEEIGRLNMELMSFPAANVKELINKEREAGLTRLNSQVEYATSLQRAIEHYCNGQVIPPDIASKCQHHADKLNAKAAVGRRATICTRNVWRRA
jgi:alanyl-tRNA synthetase